MFRLGCRASRRPGAKDLRPNRRVGRLLERVNHDLLNHKVNINGSRPERFIASRHMAELWTTFARTGRPAAIGVPEWPAYDLKDRPSMRIDTKCEVIHHRFSEELAMWRSLGYLPGLEK